MVEDGAATEARRGWPGSSALSGSPWSRPPPLSYPEILEMAAKALGDVGKGSTFRVSARRSDKTFAMGSQDIARKLGEDIVARLSLKVDLVSPT